MGWNGMEWDGKGMNLIFAVFFTQTIERFLNKEFFIAYHNHFTQLKHNHITQPTATKLSSKNAHALVTQRSNLQVNMQIIIS